VQPAPTKAAQTPTPTIAPQPTVATTSAAAPKIITAYERKLLKAQELYANSKYLDAERELADAVEAYRRAAQNQRKRAVLSEIFRWLGETRVKLFRPDSAMTSFKDSIKINQSNAEAHRGLGMIYEDLFEKKLAINEYKTYLKLAPSASDAGDIAGKIRELDQGR
jgi:tetratricopeptide (TPR) repeat protein